MNVSIKSLWMKAKKNRDKSKYIIGFKMPEKLTECHIFKITVEM